MMMRRLLDFVIEVLGKVVVVGLECLLVVVVDEIATVVDET